ncbi:hypothetical protein POF50_026475 [Streptomyces sp. SL13]|uniref:Lipoprotein n=1 Tax=Streptantibioticus silvisoli TaxID=2705255 RepID=A0AA90HDE3_9ACTN|nr:hypothetical protein [Streptantibioticus silvisoli]MDI5972847.1 hypothetical protein [Streptantibioticus silvisoli]
MSVRTSTAAWIACVLTIGVAVAGCDTEPSTATHDRAAVAAALKAVRTSRCPASLPTRQARDVGGDSLEPLVADRLLLCGYADVGIDHRTEHIRGRALVTDRGQLDRFRAALDKLGKPPGGAVSCSDDVGGFVLEIFTDGVHEVELTQSLTGCQEVSNGERDGRVGTSDVGTTVMALLPARFCQALWGRGTNDCDSLPSVTRP